MDVRKGVDADGAGERTNAQTIQHVRDEHWCCNLLGSTRYRLIYPEHKTNGWVVPITHQYVYHQHLSENSHFPTGRPSCLTLHRAALIASDSHSAAPQN